MDFDFCMPLISPLTCLNLNFYFNERIFGHLTERSYY